MKRLLLLLMGMFLAACGGSGNTNPNPGPTNYTPQYVGTYSGTYSFSFTSSTTGQFFNSTYNVAFQIAAGPNINDLVWGGTCGLDGHASDASNFITFQTTCTNHDPGTNCDYVYNFQAGTGTKNGNSLTLTIGGTATANCPAGSDSGPMTIVYHMTKV